MHAEHETAIEYNATEGRNYNYTKTMTITKYSHIWDNAYARLN